MEFSLPIPSHNKNLGSFSNAWFGFVNQFKCHRDQNGQSRSSLLLHYGAQSIQLSNTISHEEFPRFAACLKELEHQCFFKIVLCFLRHLFFNHSRNEEKSMEDFHSELCLLADWCAFENDIRDGFVKNQLISSLHDKAVKDLFLTASDTLTASDVLDICRIAQEQGTAVSVELITTFLVEQQRKLQNTDDKNVNPVDKPKTNFNWEVLALSDSHEVEISEVKLDTIFRSETQCTSNVRKTVPDFGMKTKTVFYPDGNSSFSSTTNEAILDSSAFVTDDEIPMHSMAFPFPQSQSNGFATMHCTSGVVATANCDSLLQVSQHLKDSNATIVGAGVDDINHQPQAIVEESVDNNSNSNINEENSSCDAESKSCSDSSANLHTSDNENDDDAADDDAAAGDDDDDDIDRTDASSGQSLPSTCVLDAKNNNNNNNDNSVGDMGEGHSDGKQIVLDLSGCDALNEIDVNDIPAMFMSIQRAFMKTSKIVGESGQLMDVYSCNFCAETCTGSSNAKIKEHALQAHQSLRCFVCTACNSKFSSKEQIVSHVLVKHLDVGEGHKCQICDVIFTSQNKLIQHVQEHTQTRTALCTICQTSFPTQKLLSDHVSVAHKLTVPWMCRVCGAGFSSRSALSDHVSESHINNTGNWNEFEPVAVTPPLPPKNIICRTCDLTFSDSKSWGSHNKKFHPGQKKVQKKKKIQSFPCTVCDHVSNSKSNLRTHIRTHNGERPYMCEICGKGFAQTSSLGQHMRVHTGEKPFKCRYCDFWSSISSSRLLHERCHRKERPYVCEQCGKTFRKCHYLKEHMMTHNKSRAKQFKCQHCSSAFDRKSRLKRHQMSHIGHKPYTCEICEAGFTRRENLKAHQKSKACHKRVLELK